VAVEELTSKIVAMDQASIASAAIVVRQGGIIVYPTDTVYGLGCDPFNEAALKRLVVAKGRGPKPIPVLCSSPSKAEELITFSPKAKEMAKGNWPGALTIVAPLRKRVPTPLTQGSENLGVRVPSDASIRLLIEKCGGWLTGTSANRSGSPSARTAEEAVEALGKAVDLVLDWGPRQGKESTVVQVVGDDVTILRTGPVGVGSG
jgi:L-threonylcarbamoyladenylate synthase